MAEPTRPGHGSESVKELQMALVAGVDSSTQACKVAIHDKRTGALVRLGRAAHPAGLEVHPERWWEAMERAISDAGGLRDVSAVAVAGQQHGMCALDERGEVVRPALLWNDVRSADAAEALNAELGGGDRDAGAAAWAAATGSVCFSSLTVSKLRWLSEREPANARRVSAVCLPHDWLTWRLSGHGGAGQAGGDVSAIVTDRSEASGTGYWSPFDEEYRWDLLQLAFGRSVALPRVLAPSEAVGLSRTGAIIAPGAADNAAVALGLALQPGDVAVSLGTSGVVSAVAARPTADPTGAVTGFADATGAFLPIVCTLNAARILECTARLLGVSLAELDRLALAAPPGSEGLTMVPYLAGELVPNRPRSAGAVHGLTQANSTAANLARAAIESLCCLMASALDALLAQAVPMERLLLVGGAARSEAVQRIAPSIFGRPVVVPSPGEYAARGAARQAAWVLSETAAAPSWPLRSKVCTASPARGVRERYAEVEALTVERREL